MRGDRLLSPSSPYLRVLEARFHPRSQDCAGFLVVGHLYWLGDPGEERPVIQPALASPATPAPTTSDGDPAALVIKLRYLVAVTEPESFERLQNLQSRFWSFVDVTLQKGGH